jgi:hypothetical protein
MLCYWLGFFRAPGDCALGGFGQKCVISGPQHVLWQVSAPATPRPAQLSSAEEEEEEKKIEPQVRLFAINGDLFWCFCVPFNLRVCGFSTFEFSSQDILSSGGVKVCFYDHLRHRRLSIFLNIFV